MECPKCKSSEISWREDVREDRDVKVERWICISCGAKITLVLDRLFSKIQLRVEP